mgnify:CR=1 FL=1
MSKIKLGINGFGRIGRMVFRASLKRNDVDVVGINDLLDVEHLAYLLKYDSVHGTCDASISVRDGNLIVNDNVIRITAERDPKQISWNSIDTDIVAECTGIFTSMDKAQAHIDGGAKKVVISAPSPDAPMFVMTTVHATTATQFTVDGPSKKDFRGGRSSLVNIMPASTGAAKAVTKVIPSLVGKITGMAFRVPTANVSVVDLTVKLNADTSYDEVMNSLKSASENSLKGILGFTKDLVVSQDFIGDPRTSIVDYNAGIELNSSFFKIVTWYDNEAGYSNKLIDLACHINSL